MKTIEQQFIPYELALELKELGFDEECLMYWYKANNGHELVFEKTQTFQPYISAPLWQQAFDWFREKGYESWMSHNEKGNQFVIKFEFLHTGGIEARREIETYEEARLECLKKLIELIKQL